MPELPEVEAARALAQAHLAGRTIVAVHAEPDESELITEKRRRGATPRPPVS